MTAATTNWSTPFSEGNYYVLSIRRFTVLVHFPFAFNKIDGH